MNFEEATKTFISCMKLQKQSHCLDDINSYSQGEMSVLGYLFFNDNKAIAPSEISKSINTSSARVASILNNLETKQFITRKIDVNDRRKIEVEITEEGKEHALATKEKIFNSIISIFEEMGEEDTKAFLNGMQRFVEISTKKQKGEI